jgi:hypothetical protein
MDEIQQEVDVPFVNEELSATVKAEQQAQQNQQFRAMCIDFATRAKDVDSDTIVNIAKKIGDYIKGEVA